MWSLDHGVGIAMPWHCFCVRGNYFPFLVGLVCIALVTLISNGQEFPDCVFFSPHFFTLYFKPDKKGIAPCMFLIILQGEEPAWGRAVLAQTPCNSNTSTTADGEEQARRRPHRSLQLLKAVVRWGLASAPR